MSALGKQFGAPDIPNEPTQLSFDLPGVPPPSPPAGRMTSPLVAGSFSKRDIEQQQNVPVGTPRRPDLSGRRRNEAAGGMPLHKGMLPMFATPREIQNHYQVLDGDRNSMYEETHGTNDSRAGERTQRQYRTDNAPNPRTYVNAYSSGGGELGQVPVRVRPDVNHPSPVSRYETDEEVLARKYDEADEAPAAGYHHNRGWRQTSGTRYYDERFDRTTSNPGHYTDLPGGPKRMLDRLTDHAWRGNNVPVYKKNAESAEWADQSTYNSRRHTGDMETWVDHPKAQSPDTPKHSTMVESIIHQGVLSPIRLAANQIGSQGKQSIVGGHHRFAVALNHAPDRLVPVLHHEDIHDAKADRTYPYT